MAAPSPFEADLIALLPVLRLRARRFVRTPQDAADLVGDTVLTCLEKRDMFNGVDLGAWAYTIMRNAVINRSRSARGKAVHVEMVPDKHAPATQPAQIAAIMLRETARHLNSMPEDRRRILVATRLHGASYGAAAKRFGLTVGTVKSRLSRTTDKLVALHEGAAV